jgi:hypothetical protein
MGRPPLVFDGCHDFSMTNDPVRDRASNRDICHVQARIDRRWNGLAKRCYFAV